MRRRLAAEKGDRYILPERPGGCCAQNVPVPFFRLFRRGYTLIEMTVVIACLSVIMTVAGGVVHGLLRVHHAARQGMAEQTALARLAETFRSDAHAADEVAASADAPPHTRWEFRRSGVAVAVYRIEKDRLDREAQTPAGTAHDSFALSQGASVTIDAPPRGENRPVVLTVVPGEVHAKKASWGLRVEAELARDGRLSAMAGRHGEIQPAAAPMEVSDE